MAIFPSLFWHELDPCSMHPSSFTLSIINLFPTAYSKFVRGWETSYKWDFPEKQICPFWTEISAGPTHKGARKLKILRHKFVLFIMFLEYRGFLYMLASLKYPFENWFLKYSFTWIQYLKCFLGFVLWNYIFCVNSSVFCYRLVPFIIKMPSS